MTTSDKNSVYNLISDILRLVGQYSHQEIACSLNQIDLTSRGEYRDNMLNILKSLQTLSLDSSKTSTVEKKSEAIKVNIYVRDPRIREVRAMLEDTEFMTSKQSVVKLIDTYFQDCITLRSDKKDGKKDLINKIIREFTKMDEAQKQVVYSALRRSFLKNRKSRLDEWADIIENDEAGR